MNIYRRQGFLNVGHGHKIWWGQTGNPQGTPIVLLHGGPGSCSKPDHLQFFDPKKFHLIQIDQRGCGLSQPTAELRHNTTPDLIDDIEALRIMLKINAWIVSGGSWGSTLALLYAQAHPQAVKQLLLRSIYLCRKKDNDWFFDSEFLGRLYPEVINERQRILNRLGKIKVHQLKQLLSLITKGTLAQKQLVSLLSENGEGQLVKNIQPLKLLSEAQVTQESINMNTIYLHYAIHNFFLKEGQILKNTHLIKHIPTTIIHGRLDLICPFEQAYALHQALPHATLDIVPGAGHHWSEPGMSERLRYHADKIAGV